MQRRTPIALLVLAAALSASAARAEEYNQFAACPSGGANTFTLVLQGNVVANIDLTATQNDPKVNPFYYVNQHWFGGSGTTSVTAVFNGTNTVVTFTGSNPILSSYNFYNNTGQSGEPHFGLNGSGGSFTLLSSSWTNTNTSTTTMLPSLSVHAPGVSGPNVKYITFFADVTANGQTVGQWFELPYTGSTIPTFQFTNYTSGAETLSNVGFQLSPTLIPLDNLNWPSDPPPGQSGSMFTPAPQDDQSLGPLASENIATPEPSTMVLLTSMLPVLLGWSLAVRRKHSPRIKPFLILTV
jgi:hypothetical protein